MESGVESPVPRRQERPLEMESDRDGAAITRGGAGNHDIDGLAGIGPGDDGGEVSGDPVDASQSPAAHIESGCERRRARRPRSPEGRSDRERPPDRWHRSRDGRACRFPPVIIPPSMDDVGHYRAGGGDDRPVADHQHAAAHRSPDCGDRDSIGTGRRPEVGRLPKRAAASALTGGWIPYVHRRVPAAG